MTKHSFFRSAYSIKEFARLILPCLSNSHSVAPDRKNLVNSLIEYAGLKKECLIIGVNDRLEIWALDKYNNLMSENLEQLDSIAEHLFDGDLDEA